MISFSSLTTTFQKFNRHMLLVVTILEQIQNVCHHDRTFYWSQLSLKCHLFREVYSNHLLKAILQVTFCSMTLFDYICSI